MGRCLPRARAGILVASVASDMQQHECAMSWRAHCGEVYSVEFSYDENTVYSIGEDGKVGEQGLDQELPSLWLRHLRFQSAPE